MKPDHPLDPRFCVEMLRATERPQALIYAAMHQDYSENLVARESHTLAISEEKAGEILVRRLLAHQHYGPLEHPQISFNVGYFPHSVMQQARTHRVGVSFDVQSGRYTSKRIIQAAKGERDLEDVFYLRPVGTYTDRQGSPYLYGPELRARHLKQVQEAAEQYRINVEDNGMAEEHARGLLPFDVRQHFIVSFNTRSLMHFLDLRSPRDAQLEIQQLTDLLWPHFEGWVPDVAAWYAKNRLGKNKLAP